MLNFSDELAVATFWTDMSNFSGLSYLQQACSGFQQKVNLHNMVAQPWVDHKATCFYLAAELYSALTSWLLHLFKIPFSWSSIQSVKKLCKKTLKNETQAKFLPIGKLLRMEGGGGVYNPLVYEHYHGKLLKYLCGGRRNQNSVQNKHVWILPCCFLLFSYAISTVRGWWITTGVWGWLVAISLSCMDWLVKTAI